MNDLLCQEAVEKYAFRTFYYEPYFVLAAAFLATVITLRFAFIGIKQVKLHRKQIRSASRNSLILLQNMNLSGMLTNLGAALITAYEMSTLRKASDEPCALFLPYTECFIFRAPFVLGGVNIHTAVLTFFIERLYATVRSNHYEGESSIFIVAVLITVQWSSGGLILCYYAAGLIGTDLRVPICHMLTVNTHNRYDNVSTALVIVDIVSFIIIPILLLYNKKLKHESATSYITLSARFQIRENIRFLRLAFCAASVFFVTCLLYFTFRLTIFGSEELKWTFLRNEPILQSISCVIVVILIECDSRKQRNTVVADKPMHDNIVALQDMWGDKAQN